MTCNSQHNVLKFLDQLAHRGFGGWPAWQVQDILQGHKTALLPPACRLHLEQGHVALSAMLGSASMSRIPPSENCSVNQMGRWKLPRAHANITHELSAPLKLLLRPGCIQLLHLDWYFTWFQKHPWALRGNPGPSRIPASLRKADGGFGASCEPVAPGE